MIKYQPLIPAKRQTKVGLQYKEAHRYVGIQEDIFISQFLGITQWAV
jgi:hypothetical protein